MRTGEQTGDAEVGKLDEASAPLAPTLRPKQGGRTMLPPWLGRRVGARGSEQQIRRFEIAVNNAAVMGVLEGRGNLPGQLEHFRPGQAPALQHQGFVARSRN